MIEFLVHPQFEYNFLNIAMLIFPQNMWTHGQLGVIILYILYDHIFQFSPGIQCNHPK
jgi:hypothetical protein